MNQLFSQTCYELQKQLGDLAENQGWVFFFFVRVCKIFGGT